MLSRRRQTFKEKNVWGCRREVPVDIVSFLKKGKTFHIECEPNSNIIFQKLPT
jgi:hypothetical protein